MEAALWNVPLIWKSVGHGTVFPYGMILAFISKHSLRAQAGLK